MDQKQKDVKALAQAFNLPTPSHITFENYDFVLRSRLILEEAREFVQAAGCRAYGDSCEKIAPHDPVEMIDAMVDLLVVTYGAAVAAGIDIDLFWEEVHRTNLAKVGGPVREDGKILKPAGWVPPDIKGIYEAWRAVWALSEAGSRATQSGDITDEQ